MQSLHRLCSALRLAMAFLAVITASGLIAENARAGGGALDYALCDLHVVCLFEEPTDIDWPTLYYLNDNFGCRIDLVQIQTRAKYSETEKSLPYREIYLHSFGLPTDFKSYLDTMTTKLFGIRPPDIALLFDFSNDSLKSCLIEKINKLIGDSSNFFGVAGIYEKVQPKPEQTISNPVIINSQELFKAYDDRIQNELPQLFESFDTKTYSTGRLVYFNRLSGPASTRPTGSSFLSDKNPLRMTDLAQSKIPSGPAKSMFVDKAKKYATSLNAAKAATGKERTTLIIEAYRALLDLNENPSFQLVVNSVKGLNTYMDELFSKAERAALEAVGLTWSGQIIIRETPEGQSVKYRVSVAVDGPTEVSLCNVSFHPWWDSTSIVLDSTSRTVAPHQSFVREYLINVDEKFLESNRPESLVFTAQIAYSRIPLRVTDKLPLWESPNLGIAFVPDFYFLPPVARLDVDRVVESMNWKVVISKPFDFSGNVKLHLETPKGMFAGAYRQDLHLEAGVSRQIIRVPFTISNLFELGVQQASVTLSKNGKLIATDTSRVRIAECKIPDTRKIGFLPDTTGILEDVLSMTNAGYQPVTDRTLMVGDLSAFDVLLIGSGAFRNLPSFRKVKDRFEDFIRSGGSIVVLEQPQDWPADALPASITPSMELTSTDEFDNRIPEARLLCQPYKITEKSLLSAFYKPVEVASAVVIPSERVYVTSSGSTVLSVSRLGSGQIIYCGLPLMPMISKLNIDAIHLFANILNY